MITETKKNKLRKILDQIRARDRQEIERATAGLTALNVPPHVVAGLRSLTGALNPLRVPSGADATIRRFLAERMGYAIASRCDFSSGLQVLSLTLSSGSWNSPAHQPCMPLSEMNATAIKPLKKHLRNFAYAPGVSLMKIDSGELLMVPRMRVLAISAGFDDNVISFISGLQTRLTSKIDNDPSRRPTIVAADAQGVKAGIARMLALWPVAQRSATDVPNVASEQAQKAALLRTMVRATLPLSRVIGGHGSAKDALADSMREAKARAQALGAIKQAPISSSEIYSLLGEIPLEMNGLKIRLPFIKP